MELRDGKAVGRGSAKVRSGHRGIGKGGVRQLGRVEVGAREVLSGEVPGGGCRWARQVVRFETNPLQITRLVAGGGLKLRERKAGRTAEVRIGHRGPRKIGAGQRGGRQVGVAEFAP